MRSFFNPTRAGRDSVEFKSSILILLSSLGFAFLFLSGPAPCTAFPITWNTTQGVLPNDASIPSAERFQIVNDASFVTLQPGFMNVADTWGATKVRVTRNTSGDALTASWSFEVDLRMNSHSRGVLDWGAQVRLEDGVKSNSLVFSTTSVGFNGAGANSYVGSPLLMDTTDDFHSYLVTRNGSNVNLFVDGGVTPSLTVPYTSLLNTSAEFFDVAGTSSTNEGISNFDLRSFSYNPATTPVPEPSTYAMAVIGLLGLLAYRRFR